MKKWLLCGHSNPRNLGYKLTDLRLYFPELEDFDWVDIEDFPDAVGFQNYDGVIFGAGGMLYGESERRMKSIVEFGKPVIVFGAGLNYPDDGKAPRYPEWLKDCAYVALRDYGSPYDWCPCPSCLHPTLANSFDDHFFKVTYGHQLKPSSIHLSANKDASELGAVLSYLGSARYIETDSYHGYYWARLINSLVVVEVVNPESSIKFRLLGDVGLKRSRKLVRDCYAKLLTHL